MKTIVAALDLSPRSSQVAETAISLAAAFRGDVIFIHVVNTVSVVTEYCIPSFVERADFESEKKALLDALRVHAQEAERIGVNSEIEVVEGPEAKTILERAHELDADIIVLGQPSHGAFHELFGSSVAQGIARAADIPVLLVPAAKRSDHSVENFAEAHRI